MNHATVSIFLVFFYSTSGQDNTGYDICNDMSHRITSPTIELYTPGYRIGKPYPNATECHCTVQSIKTVSRDDSLSITVKNLSLEICSTSGTPWDTLTIEAAYTFQAPFKKFVFCGNNKNQNADMLRGPPGSGHNYGIRNKIYSLQALSVTFKTDGTEQEKGAMLEIQSEQGVVLQCQYKQGPNKPTYPTVVLTTPQVQIQSTLDPEEGGDIMPTVIGAIVGLLLVLCIIVILVVIFIRRRNGKPIIPNRMMRSGHTNVAMRSQQLDVEAPSRPDTMRPVYIDPSGGPSIPPPATAEGQTVNDEYLDMDNSNSPPSPNMSIKTPIATPVYENPQNVIQTGSNNDIEQYGYIVPAQLQPNQLTHDEDKPLLIKSASADLSPPDRDSNITAPIAPNRKTPPHQNKNRMFAPPPALPSAKMNVGLSHCGSEEVLEKLDQAGKLKKPAESKPVKPPQVLPITPDTTPTNSKSTEAPPTNTDGIYSESLVKPSAFKTKSNPDNKITGFSNGEKVNKPVAVVSPSPSAPSSNPIPPGGKPLLPPAACKPATPPTNKKPIPPPTGNKPTPASFGNKPALPPTGNKPAPPPATKKPNSPLTGNKPTPPSPATKPKTSKVPLPPPLNSKPKRSNNDDHFQKIPVHDS